MPSYSGVWNLPAQMQAKASLQWPQSPGAPTNVSATAGDAQATVTFTQPTFTGIPAGVTGYLATSTPGGFTASGSSSPLTVTGLSNGTAYTFGVQATNAVGYGAAGTSGSVSPAGVIALWAGARTGTVFSNVIEQVSISTLGNSTDFGDLIIQVEYLAPCASSTRGIFAVGRATGFVAVNTIQYVTFASAGNATDFGDTLYKPSSYPVGVSNQTRGLVAGGDGPLNTINYITIASVGNAIDFGDLYVKQKTFSGSASPTRAIWFGGDDGNGRNNVIQYVTISTTGDSSDFGDLSSIRSDSGSCASPTIALIAGGNVPGVTSTIEQVTMATLGNSTSFGDLTEAKGNVAGASSSTRGLFGNGSDPSYTNLNSIDYVTFTSGGTASDFGDLSIATSVSAACSNAHGGLS
jgi:hypothetical protein